MGTDDRGDDCGPDRGSTGDAGDGSLVEAPRARNHALIIAGPPIIAMAPDMRTQSASWVT